MRSLEDREFASLFKACAEHKNLDHGCRFRDHIFYSGLFQNCTLGNTLISSYSKCGALATAQEVFDQLPVHNVVTWNALISGYAKHGQGQVALQCFERMQHESVSADAVTFLCVFKACRNAGSVRKGKEIHARIVKEGSQEQDISLGNALVDMYSKCGVLVEAKTVFEKLPHQNVVTWTSLISGYTQNGYDEEALNCFKCMQNSGLSPDAVTFVCILKACSNVGALDMGIELHSKILEEGELEKNTFVGNALVNMYAKCGMLSKALEVFSNLPVHDVVTWTVLIAGYAQQGHGEEALTWYNQMQWDGFPPNNATFIAILKACGSIGAQERGQQIHAEISSQGLLDGNSLLVTALVDMYIKCCMLQKAETVFYKLSIKDAVSWTTMISGYIQDGSGEDTLDCFKRMQNEGICPDVVASVSILKACALLGAVDRGKEIHAKLVEEGLEKRVLVATPLIDMYAKCGSLAKAQEVFDQLPVNNVASWSALIAGYGQLGEDGTVVKLFNKMVMGGTEPDPITFTIVLNSCSHSGLVEKGQMYFERMSKTYGMIPSLEHYTCMVNLFARAGHLGKTVTAIKERPMNDSMHEWTTLLSTSQKWGDVELGKKAFEHARILDQKHAGTYVNMWNTYSFASIRETSNKTD